MWTLQTKNILHKGSVWRSNNPQSQNGWSTPIVANVLGLTVNRTVARLFLPQRWPLHASSGFSLGLFGKDWAAKAVWNIRMLFPKQPTVPKFCCDVQIRKGRTPITFRVPWHQKKSLWLWTCLLLRYYYWPLPAVKGPVQVREPSSTGRSCTCSLQCWRLLWPKDDEK